MSCFAWLIRYVESDRPVVPDRPATVVMDASILINFLRIDRMDLIADHPQDFIVTDHVAEEISDWYPIQQERFADAIETGTVSKTAITHPEEIALFSSLSASGRLGSGECSAIAMAVNRCHPLVIDDRRAIAQARYTDRALRILTTQDLVISMIREHLLGVAEADKIKNEWADKHRFHLKLRSFREMIP